MRTGRAAITAQVKEASDIVAVIGAYLTVLPNGSGFKALCPFHSDSRPSLQIDPKWQNFRCWACDKRGDVFTFIQEMEKVSFPQAVEFLANRAGINLQSDEQTDNRRQLFAAMKWAQETYQHFLLESKETTVDEARAYLGQRKLAGPTVRQFGLGYAPLAGTFLQDEARRAGKDLELLEEVGLLGRSKYGSGYYDRFRDRVMFPIRDLRGQTVGFGGRILPNSPLLSREPKYYNSQQTPLFNKSEVLYGLDLAREAGVSEGYLAVVEGYTDVMMAHQHGVGNVVATMGTALNAKHVHQLRRIVSRVVLVFDADAGGSSGVDRALEIFVGHEVDLKIATLPEDMDPCDLLIAEGPEPFRKALSNAVDALDFKLSQLLASENKSGVEGTLRTIDAILKVMALAPRLPGQNGRAKQELLITRIAHRVGLRQETVWARFGELQGKRESVRPQSSSPRDAVPSEGPKAGPAPPLERQFVEILLAEPGLVARAVEAVPEEEISHPGLRKLVSGLYQMFNENESPELDGLRLLIQQPNLIQKAMELRDVGRSNPDRPQWFERILQEFRQRRIERQKSELTERLSSTLDHEAAMELLRKLQNPEAGSDS